MLFTHKAEILFLEQSKIYTEDGRLVFAQTKQANPYRFNIPYLNTQMLILGKGTSITHSAIEKLKESHVILVSAGAKGLPFIMLGNNYYSTNEYAQGYLKQWFIEENRLKMAKYLFSKRIEFNRKYYLNYLNELDKYNQNIQNANTIQQILGYEADFVKNFVYKTCANEFNIAKFKRNQDILETNIEHDKVNSLLNHGNNLAYGLSAGVLWIMGIPAQFPLIHGQTRNSGFIFDVADLIKDTIVCPWAFEHYNSKIKTAMYDLRDRIKDYKADEYLFKTLKELSCGEF